MVGGGVGLVLGAGGEVPPPQLRGLVLAAVLAALVLAADLAARAPARARAAQSSLILEALKLLFLLRSSCSPDTGYWIGRTQPGVFGHWVAPETESR